MSDPVRVKTESGALVTIPGDFYEEGVHEKYAGSDENESATLADGVTFRPPTYPSTKAAKKAASSSDK